MIKPAPSNAEFSIRDLTAEFGVTARALRFYESKGLLKPDRRGQARVYSANDRARLALVLRGKRVGFSLDDIKEMLDLDDISQGGRAAMASAITRFDERIEALKRQRADIDHAVEELEAGRAWLKTRLADEEPSPELKTRAAAFEELAKSWLYGGESPAAAD